MLKLVVEKVFKNLFLLHPFFLVPFDISNTCYKGQEDKSLTTCLFQFFNVGTTHTVRTDNIKKIILVTG